MQDLLILLGILGSIAITVAIGLAIRVKELVGELEEEQHTNIRLVREVAQLEVDLKILTTGLEYDSDPHTDGLLETLRATRTRPEVEV